jgi:ABC-type Na+ efflux pump permease subunit
MDFGFIKSRYDFELQRREQLTTALTLPVGILGLLGGAIIAMARSFSYNDSRLTVAFGTLLSFDAVAFAACLIVLGRVYHRQTYMYLPLLGDLERTRETFLEAAQVMAGGEAEVLEAYDRELRRHVIEAADRNTVNNDERSRLLYWARLSLFAVLALTATAGLPYVVDQVRY